MPNYLSNQPRLFCNEVEMRKRVAKIVALIMKLVENEPEEIEELVLEMLENTGKEELSEEQERFEALAGEKPECYGISPIGKTYSLRHKELLISR